MVWCTVCCDTVVCGVRFSKNSSILLAVMVKGPLV
jgi:hypothetical protein